MPVYLIHRLGLSLLTLVGVSLLAFFLIRIVPGDAVRAQLGQHYTERRARQLRAEYGLDGSVAAQYGRWIQGVVRGDLGPSFYMRKPVGPVVLDHLPITLELAGLAMALATLGGVPLGVLAAVRHHRPGDYAATGLGVLGVSVPNFWLATLMILLFSYGLRWLPSGGAPPSLLVKPWANLRHMVMPAIALGAAVTAVVMRMTRSAMVEVLEADHIRTARAKGLNPSRVILKHALRNAMIPILTIMGVQAGYLLGGSIVIEMVFALPGIGWLAFQAATNRDYFLLQAVILLIAAGFILINLVVDIAYGLLDPRLRPP